MEGSRGIDKFIHWCRRTRNLKKRFIIHFFLRQRIEKEFRKEMGYPLNLEHPVTLNEKLQWFKMYVRDPLITRCADKYAVRDCVREKIGEEHLVPLYGVYSSVQEINLDDLPDQFVLKPNHESGRVIICHDKKGINWIRAADMMDNWLHENYYYWTAEWGYKNIPPKIICEKLLTGSVIDYKFYSFKGHPVFLQIIENSGQKYYRSGFYDVDFCRIPGEDDTHPRNSILQHPFQRPENWMEMISIAEKLAEDFPFVRVDLYDINGHIYFGELTFTPMNGMAAGYPDGWDKKMGDLFDLTAFKPEYVLTHTS